MTRKQAKQISDLLEIQKKRKKKKKTSSSSSSFIHLLCCAKSSDDDDERTTTLLLVIEIMSTTMRASGATTPSKTASSSSHFLEDRKKKVTELCETLVERILPREIISGDNIEDEQLAEENYVKCVEFCRTNCRLASTSMNSTTSKEEVKRECLDILDRFAREAQMSKRYSLTVLFDALERENERNRRKFTYEDEDDEEFWSRVALFLLRSAGKPMKSAYEPSSSSLLKSLEDEERERRERRRRQQERREQEEHASSVEDTVRLPEISTARTNSSQERSKKKNRRGESSSSDSSLSEWSNTDDEEEDVRRRRRGGGMSTPKQTKIETEKKTENRSDDNTSTFSFESLSSDNDDEVSFSDDDIEEDDGYSIRIRDEDEENANEEDPGFSWRSLPDGIDEESLEMREFHGSSGKNTLGTSSTSHENARKISRASFAQMERARRMLRKLRNSTEKKDKIDISFFSLRVDRGRMRKFTTTVGESLVVSRTLNAIASGGVANFDIESMEIPHVSKSALTNVLKTSKQIMDVFEDIGRVKERLKNLSNLFAVEGKQSPTVQAFVSALMKMKAEIQHGFDELFEASRRASAHADAFSAPTLLRLSIESRKLARKASCLQRIADMCSPGPKSSVGKFAHPATASSTILSMLYNLMNEYNGLSGSLDEFSIVFRCFFSSSTSYFNALDVWINYGILTSPEIFVDWKKSTRWREGWYLREDKDVPVFFKSVAEDILNAGIYREFSRMKFADDDGDDDVQNQAGKKLTFVPKMISELKALLLLRTSSENKDENDINDDTIAASTRTLRTDAPVQIEQDPAQSQGDDNDAAFSTEDALLSDLKSIVSLTKARSRKSAHFSHSSKETTKTTFSECYDFINWASTYFDNDTCTTLGIPVNTLVSKSMLHQIRLAAMNASDQALEKLKSAYGVKAELTKLRALFLGGCGEVALDFSNHVFEEFESIRRRRDEESGEIGESMGEAIVRFDTTRLTEVLRDAILEHTNESTFGSRESVGNKREEFRVQVFYARPSLDNDDDEYKGSEELQALTDLNIIYQKKKTHAALSTNSNAIAASLICDAVSLSKYNEVFKYLLQLRFAQRSLDYGVLSQWTSENRRRTEPSPSTSGKTLSISSSLEIELKHFVLTLRTFVTTKILSVEWNRLLEFIDDSAQSIDDVKLAHEVYLDNISRVALATPDSTWSLLSTHIKIILTITTEFGNVRRQEEEEGGDVGVKLRELSMRRMEKKFTVARANVLKILKNLDAESDDAESLYEQLNFNNYYRN